MPEFRTKSILRPRHGPSFILIVCLVLTGVGVFGTAAAEMIEYDTVEITTLDKITARTQVFSIQSGQTITFGTMSIRPRTCQKSEPIDHPKTASFLEIWEDKPDEARKWVFSGWMFAGSPALSSLDHPVYDIWVTDCLGNPVYTAEDGSDDQSGELGIDIIDDVIKGIRKDMNDTSAPAKSDDSDQ